MLKDVTLGQYFPGETAVHKMDPRTKLVLVIVYIVALFLAKGAAGYALVAGCLLAVVWISKIHLKVILKGLKPLMLIIILTAVLNLFYGQGEPLVQFWIFKITKQGIENAVFMVLRITLLVAGTFMLTYTTSPIALTDGLESLLSPLKKIGAPVHELAMMMCIALRFIPTLIEETDKIMSAQKARGADFESGNILARAKALIPILAGDRDGVPLLPRGRGPHEAPRASLRGARLYGLLPWRADACGRDCAAALWLIIYHTGERYEKHCPDAPLPRYGLSWLAGAEK